MSKTKDIQALKAGLIEGDRTLLSQAITLIESQKEKDQELAENLVDEILPLTGNSLRLGISGVPGAGKSTFIDSFGTYLTGLNKKVAVLTIDPSSVKSGGSILGDKTRMHRLSQNPLAYIRPTPNGLTLGGVAQKTRESLYLCEAAGFDIILIETVGVGQSEHIVSEMVDLFILLVLSGAGDELQGIKRGVMEMADIFAINKADGENLTNARLAKTQLEHALSILKSVEQEVPPVHLISSLEEKGIEEFWKSINQLCVKFDKNLRRQKQQISWFEQKVYTDIKEELGKSGDWKKLKTKILAHEISVPKASRELIKSLLEK